MTGTCVTDGRRPGWIESGDSLEDKGAGDSASAAPSFLNFCAIVSEEPSDTGDAEAVAVADADADAEAEAANKVLGEDIRHELCAERGT